MSLCICGPGTGGLQTGADQTCFGRSELGPISGCSIVFVPHFVLRQLSSGTAPSSPVRTPTFNPVIELNYFGWGRPRDEYTTLVGLTLRLGHYSNGSDGCLYANRTGSSCDSVIADRAATINERDGSFSTHYVEPGVSVAQLNFDKDGIERLARLYGIAFRWNPPKLDSMGGMDEQLAELYGRRSLHLSYGVRWRTTAWRVDPAVRLQVEYERAFGRPDSLERDRGMLEAAAWSPHTYGLGLVARYAWGWDYYNVGFSHALRGRFALGVLVDHTRAVTHTVAAARAVARRRR